MSNDFFEKFLKMLKISGKSLVKSQFLLGQEIYFKGNLMFFNLVQSCDH